MSYGIVRVQKMGAGSVKGIEIHDRREKDGISHTNKDIDWSKTGGNFDLVPAQHQNFGRAVKDRIRSLELPRAVRKDAVVMAQVLVTSDKAFFDGMSADRVRAFFEDSYAFLVQRYGEANVISATVHMDERTPHMHFNFVPVTPDGRLSAKSILTRENLVLQQDDFYKAVGKKYGLQRGIQGGAKHHLDTAEYKKETLLREVSNLERSRDALRAQIEAMKGVATQMYEITRVTPRKTLTGAVRGISVDDIERLKETATLYHDTARKLLEASKRVEQLQRSNGSAHRLAQEVSDLKMENRGLSKQLETVLKAFKRSPELLGLYRKTLRSMEREQQELQQNRHHDHGMSL